MRMLLPILFLLVTPTVASAQKVFSLTPDKPSTNGVLPVHSPATVSLQSTRPHSPEAPVVLGIPDRRTSGNIPDRTFHIDTPYVEFNRNKCSYMLRRLRLDLKTNLLWDALATVSLGVEIPLGGRFSLDVPVNYNAWDITEKLKWRHLLVQPELRLWLKEPMRGHFFGVHIHAAWYNIGNIYFSENMKNHRYQGFLAGAGISYGYRWRFRNPRWSMEATFGAGYAYITHTRYLCVSCGEGPDDLEKGGTHWMGPTRAGLSLAYSINKTRK